MLRPCVLILPLLLAIPQIRAADHHHAAGDTDMAAHLSEDTGAGFDVHYLMMMVNHHKSGMDMAKAAQDKAERQEVKTFAAKMIADQTRDIEQMTALLTGMGAAAGEGHASFRDQAQADLADLRRHQGTEFDRAFLMHMAKHHQGAVAAAKLADRQAAAQSVKDLAKMQAEMQMKEVEQLQSWHKEWFGSDLPAAAGAGAAHQH